MKKAEVNLSVSSRGLQYKLKIAFYLMSLLPFLVSLYLVSSYIVPSAGFRLDIVVAFALSFFITLFGLSVLRDIFGHMTSLSVEAKRAAATGSDIKLDIDRDDEIGDLSRALNQLTHRVRTEMDELTVYSEKSSKINLDVQKHVAVVSNLLQVSYLVSQDAKLDDMLKLIVEKSNLLSNADTAYLISKPEGQEVFKFKEAVGKGSEPLLQKEIGAHDPLFDVFMKTDKPILLDHANKLPQDITASLGENFAFLNILILPVYVKGKARTWLGIASAGDNFVYDQLDIKFLDTFAKLASIAIENDLLVQRLEKLEIKDSLTGLYNEAFITNRLQEEINRAILYQRPCALIVLNISRFEVFRQRFGPLVSETTLKRIASLIREGVTEVDRVGRTQDNEFAIVLPEKNKRQAQHIAQKIKQAVENAFSQEQDADKRLTADIGVSENPIDGVEAQELLAKARNIFTTV